MAITKIDIETFLKLAQRHPVIDVRSEGEYAHAHFPGSVSLPLFDNEERKVVGTAYKQESRKKAIKLGLHLFGNKMVSIVEAVEKLLNLAPDTTAAPGTDTVILYCWRGGMRSGGVGWLLDLYGFKVYTVVGGYKGFRRWGIQQLLKDYPLKIVGGYTGSGKTYVLGQMRQQQQAMIDLEDLAKHKGSAFGKIGMPDQPSQEMFENLLALAMNNAMAMLTGKNEAAYIWIEDESQRIGLVNIPAVFFAMMRSKQVYFLDIPFDERLKHITAEYGIADRQELVSAVERIQKRLGGLETKTAINHINEGNLAGGFAILLKYYDKQYVKGLHTRPNLTDLLHKIPSDRVDAAHNATTIINTQNNLHD